jgi:hypothetical protein
VHESPYGPSRHFAAAQQLGRFWRKADINWKARSTGSVANDPTVWTGRAVQAECEQMEGVVLRICIRPLDGAYVLLAIMDIRAHAILFWERP